MKNNINRNKIIKGRKVKILLFSVLFSVFVIGLIISLLQIFFWSNDNNNILKLYDNSYWQFIKMPLIDVDIDKLINQNKDTVGWINVNNTNINYPFVQTKDNKYYLKHAFDRSWNEAGWVFLDYRNNKDFSSRNNIIYGHSRLDKTMFGSLRNVLNDDWYNNKSNHVIRLSTQSENTMWQVFSVYKILEESYYITTDFSDDTEYSKFLKTIKNRSVHDFGVGVSSDDKILTLSTCSSNNKRIVVHAKLIKRGYK